MRSLLLILLAGVLLAGLGCGGGDKDKGIHKNQDRPRATDR
jgi:hypothetical protein